jgi:hypothetical protein
MPGEVAGSLDDAAKQEIISMIRAVHEEDIEVNEGPWRGLNAGLTRQGRLSLFEAGIWQLNQLWLDRLKLK